MKTLQHLVVHYLKQNHLNKYQFVQLLGYRNINKGLRVFEQFCSGLQDDRNIGPKIQRLLAIPENGYQQAFEHTQHQLAQRERAAFKPWVQVLLTGKPRPLFSGMALSPIVLDENFEKLTFNRRGELMHHNENNNIH